MIRRINLVPLSERPRTRTDYSMLALLVACVIVVAAMVLGYVYLDGVLADRQRELDDLSVQVRSLQGELAALNRYEELAAKRKAAEEVVQYIWANRTLVSQSLGDLSLVIPTEVWLKQLTLSAPEIAPYSGKGAASAGQTAPSRGKVDMTGVTFTFDDVAVLLVRLQQVASFADVKLGTATYRSGKTATAGPSLIDFQASAEVVNTQRPDAQLPVTRVQVKP